jgi:hypothetical protein
MELQQKRRILSALFILTVFVFHILTSGFTSTGNGVRFNSDAKKRVSLIMVMSVPVKNAAEQLSTTLSLIKHYGIEKILFCAFWIHVLELFTNPALHTSGREYNTFYTLTAIHAP